VNITQHLGFGGKLNNCRLTSRRYKKNSPNKALRSHLADKKKKKKKEKAEDKILAGGVRGPGSAKKGVR